MAGNSLYRNAMLNRQGIDGGQVESLLGRPCFLLLKIRGDSLARLERRRCMAGLKCLEVTESDVDEATGPRYERIGPRGPKTIDVCRGCSTP